MIEDSNLLFDEEKEFNYSNYGVKKGLEENKDYILISEEIWKFFKEEYGGRDVRRQFINIDDKDYYLLEIWLKKVRSNAIRLFIFFFYFLVTLSFYIIKFISSFYLVRKKNFYILKKNDFFFNENKKKKSRD